MRGFVGFLITILLAMTLLGGVYMWYNGELPDSPNSERVENEESESELLDSDEIKNSHLKTLGLRL